jgi:hypothetical protein
MGIVSVLHMYGSVLRYRCSVRTWGNRAVAAHATMPERLDAIECTQVARRAGRERIMTVYPGTKCDLYVLTSTLGTAGILI